MAALNFQTLDLPMQLNLGFFELNGRCGYVLKPECMRKKDRHFDPFETDTIEHIVANTVTVKVLVTVEIYLQLLVDLGNIWTIALFD